jgi:hypothetical protein
MTDPPKSPLGIYALSLEESLVPWRSPESWGAANQTIAHLIDLQGDRLGPAKETAACILTGLSGLEPAFHALCRATCVACPSPCCLIVDVRYDLRDLLFMHFTGQKIPDGQPRRKTGDTCRYLKENGCILSRLRRPWICTWYVCPAMKRQIELGCTSEGHRLQETIKDIGELRKEMENIFIRVVAG